MSGIVSAAFLDLWGENYFLKIEHNDFYASGKDRLWK